MRQVWLAAVIYFAVVFAAAFAMGVLRVTVMAPQIGALAAVAVEVPVILVVSWFVAGAVLRRWPLGRRQRLAMGVLAFGILMLVETAFATMFFAQSLVGFFAAMATPPGLLGLAGQLGFAAIPVLRR